jgi:hypothetical protein
LVNANFSPNEVGALVANHRHEVQELVVERKTIVRAGAILGVILGAASGLLILACFGWISLTSPFEALQAVIVGAAMGLFVGALGGIGYWKHAIDFPKGAFDNGAVLVGVATHRGRVEQARAVLRTAGARRTYASSKNGAAERALTWASVDPQWLSAGGSSGWSH